MCECHYSNIDIPLDLEGGQVLSGLTFLVLVPTSLLRGLHDMEKSLLL